MELGKAPDPGTIALLLVTAGISVGVGVFGRKLAESILELMLRPFRWTSNALYTWIAPRNPFSISMRTYRRGVLRSNLARMENPVGPDLDVPLEHAFAPLKLKLSANQESIDLFAYVATTHRCMVLGGPGTGKTTLMKSLVTSIIKKQCRIELNTLIPVFVVLRNLAKKQHTVTQAIVSALADHNFPGADDFVDSSLNAGKMVIVLDGLDEVGANRGFVVDQILSFCQSDALRDDRNRVLVTCREYSYTTMDLHAEIPSILRVEPFANHHMRVFLGGWPLHKGRSALSLYTKIQEDPQIRDICRNPLLLTILTGLYLDIDDFELPKSRERFYQSVIDELLIRRPARRLMTQAFYPDDKRQILERVALERLESVDRNEDPEELTQGALRKKAEEVLRTDKFDHHQLITELVDINGIIKPVSENSYTCAHRTIQEYFAAREALRSREAWMVVTTYGDRSELIEVLYFYCALQRNLPVLQSIVGALIEQNRWLEAGRSLLYMQEAPGKDTVAQVATQLFNLIIASPEIKIPLEVLSSLANRRGLEFEMARQCFAQAIDHLAVSNEAGASALESAIATSPEIALKLIPGLLKHASERWRSAAVQLLRDIGTDEALDQLVQLLRDQDSFVRSRAGLALAGMIRSRNRELRQRASLLPQRTDKIVWPLELYFPGAIAIPIAEAIRRGETSESEAVNNAMRAIAMRDQGVDDRSFRQWRRIQIDATLRQYRRKAAVLMKRCGLYFAPALAALFIIAFGWSKISGQVLIISTSAPYVASFESEVAASVHSQARKIDERIHTSYPPVTYGGWQRIFPWNWLAKPTIPTASIDAYMKFVLWPSERIDLSIVDNFSSMSELRDLLPSSELENLERAIVTLHSALSFTAGKTYRIFDGSRDLVRMSLTFTLSLVALMWFYVFRRMRAPWPSALDYPTVSRPWTLFYFIIIFICFNISTVTSEGSTLIGAAPLLTSVIALLWGSIIGMISWPNNPLLATVGEVQG